MPARSRRAILAIWPNAVASLNIRTSACVLADIIPVPATIDVRDCLFPCNVRDPRDRLLTDSNIAV
jgi:hypothetical protein